MILMDEMIPLKLYSSKMRAYIPFNVVNKKKGAMITLLTNSLDDSIDLINMPFIYNPKYFVSYYMNRNVNYYLSKNGNITVEDDESEDAAVSEAVIHIANPNSPKYDTEGSQHDLHIISERFSKKNFNRWYDYFKIKSDKRIYPVVYGFNSAQSMAKAIGDKAIIDHGTMITNSYNTTEEIFVINPSDYNMSSILSKSDGTYEMYCDSAIITYIVSTHFRKASWYLANHIGCALSGQADYLYKENDYAIKSDDRISVGIMISRLEREYGRSEVIKLVRTGEYEVLARLGARDFINRVKPLFQLPIRHHNETTVIAISESVNIPDNKIAIGTDFHFIGYNDDKTKIVMKPKSYIEKIIEKENDIVGKDGIFIFLGDILYKAFRSEYDIPEEMKKEAIEYIKRFTGKYKILVKGNHDNLPDEFYINTCGFTHVCSALTYNNILFTHQPEIVKPPLINIHGHMHGTGKYTEGKPQDYMDVWVVNKSHIDTLENVLKKQPEYEKTISQADNIDRANPHQYISGERLSLQDIIGECVLTEMSLDPSIKTDKDLSNWMRRNINYKQMGNLMTPEEVLKEKNGCCHDQVVFELSALRQLGYRPSAWLVFEYNESNGQAGETHSYVTYTRNGKLMWFENAWGGHAGIHEVRSHTFIEDMHKSHEWGNINQYPSLEITKFKYNTGDSLQELIDRSTNESAILESDGSHSDVIRVYKSMNKSDQEFISSDGSYQNIDNSRVCYRHIERDGFLGIKGFVECFRDFDNIASVVIGVHPKYRGEGLATKMMEQLLKEFPKENPDINELVWRADVKNKKSKKLAEKFGFKMIRKSNIQVVYRYEFKPSHKYDDIPDDILSEEDIVKWVRKNLTIDTTPVNKRDKVMPIKDIIKKKNVKEIDAMYFCYRAIKKMSLDCALLLYTEHRDESIEPLIFGDLHAVVTFWYTTDKVYLLDPWNLKTGIGYVQNADGLLQYQDKLHKNMKWGDVNTYPYLISFPVTNVEDNELWYKDVFRIDDLAREINAVGKYSLLEFSTKNRLMPPEKINDKLPMNLQRLKKIELNDKVINQYKEKMLGLSHVRTTNSCHGYLFIDPKNGNPVCYYNTQKKKDTGGVYGGEIIWLQAIEVSEEYQGRSLSKQLLQMAIANDHVTNLAVAKDNEVAYRLYTSMGFKQYNINGNMINMQLPNSTKEFALDYSKSIMTLDENVFVFTEDLSQSSYDMKLRQYLYAQRLRTSSAQIDIYNTVKSRCPIIRKAFITSSMYNGLNLFVDLSYYNSLFLANNKTARDIAIKFYWEFLNRLMDMSRDPSLSSYGKNTIFIPVWKNAWPTEDGTNVYDWAVNLNPISMIFRMLKKNPDELRNKWKDKDIVFIGKTGYFKVDFSKFALKDFAKFKIRLDKIYRGEPIDSDPDEDGYTSEPGDSDSSAAITAKVIDKIEDTTGIEVNDISSAIDQNDSQIKFKLGGSVVKAIPNMRIRNTMIKNINTTCSIGIVAPSDDTLVEVLKSNPELITLPSKGSMVAFYSK